MRIHRTRLMLTAATCVGAAASSSALADHFSIYVLTGQSNSLGTTADPDEPDITPGDHAADPLTPFFWSNVKTQYPPLTLYGDSGGQILTLQAQQGDGGNNPLFWGPEMGFARSMCDAGESDVMVIKISRGGGGNTHWSKAHSGSMYTHIVDSVTLATTALTDAGHTFEIVGFLYLQGESDSSSEASVSGQRLGLLIDNLRGELPSASDMYAVIGGIAAPGGNRNTVRAQQSALAAGDPTIAYFSNLDLAGMLYDGLHFDKDAKFIIGGRYADEFLNASGDPLIETVNFDAVANEPGATGIIFDRYVPDLDGAANGPVLVNAGTFTGFADGLNGEPAVGILVDGSAGRVVFADYYGSATTSDLAAGDFDFEGNGFPSDWTDSGVAIALSIVDPANPAVKATVSGIAFELSAVGQGDDVTATFLDADGVVLHQTGVLGDGRIGFLSLDGPGGNKVSNIHQVILEGNPEELWTVGHVGDDVTLDVAICGFVLAGCAPDINGDGEVNTQDFLAFLNLWATGDPDADWNDDGTINTQDFLAYLNDWAAGC